jgi:hypothetical protein
MNNSNSQLAIAYLLLSGLFSHLDTQGYKELSDYGVGKRCQQWWINTNIVEAMTKTLCPQWKALLRSECFFIRKSRGNRYIIELNINN